MILVGVAFAGPDWPRAEQVWSVSASVATGAHAVHASYELTTRRSGPGEFSVATRRSIGTWGTDDREEVHYDSANPSPHDPWPLTLQHAVAGVPVAVRLVDGRPAALVDPEGWATEVRAALSALGLPVEADEAGEALVDADGLLADLQRTFPGRPAGETWERTDRIAGMDVTRRELCDRPRAAGGITEVRCAGWVEGPSGGAARLLEVATTTRIVWDRRGLSEVHGTYSGTLVVSGSDGVVDKPIAGLRSVRRAP